MILLGYQSALLTKRLVNSEVCKRKEEFESQLEEEKVPSQSNGRILGGNYGTIGIGANLNNFNNQIPDDDDEEKEEESVDVNIDQFLENQYANQASQEPRRELAGANISRMIQQYNAYEPDFGQKIKQETEEWIDPLEIINSDQRKPFKIKQKTKIFKGVASGQNIMSANRQKLEEDRRQMMQFNIAGNNISVNARIEEEKKNIRKPPRVGSSKNRTKQQSLRINYNPSYNQESSMMNQSSTLYGVVNRSNRVVPPCPVRIPREVTEGVELLRSIRMAAEGKSGVNQSSHFEETKSPGSFISPQNILETSASK